MTVVIPTGQYANIQPQVIGVGPTFEEAQNDALRKAQSFYDKIEAQAAFKVKQEIVTPVSSSPVVPIGTVMKCWASGTEVYFDPVQHAYVDSEGQKYVSGSVFASQFEHEFPKEAILPGYAKRYGLKEYQVEEMWTDKGEASTTFGTALHKSMETYLRHCKTAKACGKDALEMIHPMFRPLVEMFFTEKRMAKEMIPEMFIADPHKHRCGQLDLVTIVDRDKKILDIEDYKSNVDLFKMGDPKTLKAPYSHLPNMPAAKYTLQLSFYKAIFESHGWTVRNIILHQPIHKDGAWQWDEINLRPESVDLKPIDLSIIK